MIKLALIAALFAQVIYAFPKRGQYLYPLTDDAQKEMNADRSLAEKKDLAQKLALIKYDIINGKLERAKIRLQQAKFTQDFTRPIQYRYLAILHFIEGDYKKSLDFLTTKDMDNFAHEDNVCLLRTLNLIILNQAERAKDSWRKCEEFLLGKKQNDIWMQSLLDLKLAQETEAAAEPLKGVAIENEKLDSMRLYMKLALYLGKMETIFPRLKFLNLETLENPRTRELVGMMYFRDFQFVKAYNYIEDLSTPNSENLKGNILLAQDKLELAYAQFKLALKRKNNSQNALERITPTAWRLNQWSEGASFAARLEETPENREQKAALEAAFLSKSGMHKKSDRKLGLILYTSPNAKSLEVNQLSSFNAMMLGNKKRAKDFAKKSCQQDDAFSCWLNAQMLIWEDLTIMAKKNEPIYQDSNNLLDTFKSSFEKAPIQEAVYVNQKDIEELEDLEIRLLNLK